MMKTNKVCNYLVTTITAVFLCLGSLCVEAFPAEETQRSALRNLPTLSIEVYRVNQSVTSDFDIDIILTNLTDKAIDVKAVKTILPEAIKATRGRTLKEIEVALHTVQKGNERIYRQHIPAVHIPFYKSLLDPYTLLFAPGKYVLRSEVEFIESGGTGSTSIYEKYELSLKAPLSAMIRGGVLGAFLLAFFIPAYRARQSEGTGAIKLKKLLQLAVILFIAGSIVSITAILLLQRIGTLDLPITIAVNDWLGGLVVGLFSYPIGKVLYRQFSGQDED